MLVKIPAFVMLAPMNTNIATRPVAERLQIVEKYHAFMMQNFSFFRGDRGRENRFHKWFKLCVQRGELPTLAQVRLMMSSI